MESIVFPSEIKKGKAWESSDKKWKYKIKSLSANLSTPYCEFENLLKMEVFNKEMNTTYQLFYKKGVGLVGTNMNEKPYSFIAPNGEVEEKDIIAIGCENIKNDRARKNCTNKKIIEFIQNHIKNPSPGIHGKVLYEITIDEKGKVANVTVKESNGVSNKQIKSGLKTLKKLPKFIPGYSGEKPVRVIYNLPIAFLIKLLSIKMMALPEFTLCICRAVPLLHSCRKIGRSLL